MRHRFWKTVDDEFLIVWREHLRRSSGISINRVNTALRIIFAFYRWAEETKRIRYTVGIYTPDQLPDKLSGIAFAITAVQCYSKGRHGKVFGRWTTPLTISAKQGWAPTRHTPTEDQVQKLHEVVIETVNGERDSLMLSWAEETGLRRAEFMQLRKSHLPSPDQLSELIDKDDPWLIEIVRKGGASKSISVLPDLIFRTQDYIEFARQQTVDNCRKALVGYREPDEIFLSTTTGLPLHLDSVTSIGRRGFRKAGIKRSSGHRLRARFAIRTIETLVDALFTGELVGPESSWAETILIKAAEMMGHASPKSLRPYLNYVLNRRIQTSDAVKAEKLASRLRQLTLQERVLTQRLEGQRELHVAARHLQAGKSSEAAAILRSLADRLARR